MSHQWPVLKCPNNLIIVSKGIARNSQSTYNERSEERVPGRSIQSTPFSLYSVCPLGLAEGTYSRKMHLVVDLSVPHNSDKHTSLNELINKEEYSLSYVKLDDYAGLSNKRFVG